MENSNSEQTNPHEGEKNWMQYPSVIAVMMLLLLPGAAIQIFVLSIIIFKATHSTLLGYGLASFINLAIYSTNYIQYSTATLLSLFGYLLFLWLLMYMLYFAYAFPQKKIFRILLGMYLILFCVTAFYVNNYRKMCNENYSQVEARKGQTLSFNELKTECGNPVCYRHINGGLSHWVYTNGEKVIPVKETKDGQVEILKDEYYLFD